jgi:hypothetical protein
MAKKGKPLSPKAKLLIGSSVAVITGGVVVWLFRSGPCGTCAAIDSSLTPVPAPPVQSLPATTPVSAIPPATVTQAAIQPIQADRGINK